jgi:hypothetical protein
MHEQGAQINIAALAYPMLSNASACSSLSRYQPEPRCEFTAGFESGRVADCRDRGSCGEQADAGDLDQSLALLGPAQGIGQSTFDHCHFDPGIEHVPLFSQTHNQHFWQSLGCLCQSTGPRPHRRGIPGRQHDAEPIQNAAQCIRLHDAKLHQLFAHAMQGRDALLMLGFQSHDTRLELLDSGPDHL